MTSDWVFGWFQRGLSRAQAPLDRNPRPHGEAVDRASQGATRSAALALLVAGVVAGSARAAEPSYPFEGTWVRANRVCAANAPRVRTYTTRDVTFPTGHCTFRKVATGGGQFEIFEECRKAERPGNYTETIRMQGSDLMQMRRQATRLKIARPLRYMRCTIAAPAPANGPPKAAVPIPRRAAEAMPGIAEEHAVRLLRSNPPDTSS